MSDRFEIRGCKVPGLLYGTAWKEEQTRTLVEQAIDVGFRGFDTANQRKHYFEEGVGQAVRACLDRGVVTREDLFLQTKFTFLAGQDGHLPYDPRAPVAEQVHQSFERSLAHLGVDHLDSLILHGPTRSEGLGDEDWEALRAMEALVASGRVGLLGVSNVSAGQLELVCDELREPPAFVQNRCFARRGWDASVRAVCARRGVVYQGFSLLTANQRVLRAPVVARIAERLGRTVAQVVFRFAVQLGMIPLTGSTDPEHLRQDLAVRDFTLSNEEISTILEIGVR